MDGRFGPDHVQEEWFEQYVLGTLPEEQAAILESRLLIDETCRQKLDQTEAYVQAMRLALRRAQTELPARNTSPWRAWLARPLPLAASGLAVAALLLTVMLLHRPVDALGPILETVPLEAERGTPTNAAAHAGHLQLRLDVRGLPQDSAHTIQVVTENGQPVWSGPLTVSTDYATVDVRQKLVAGDYLVRINAGAEQLREFHLAVQ